MTSASYDAKLRDQMFTTVEDLTMPQLNGLAATRPILKAVPGTRVLILSAQGDNAYVERVAALGADG